jgi:hypothetical protein
MNEISEIKTKEYIKISKNATIFILILFNSYSILLTLAALFYVPTFRRYCEELLEGEPIPVITNYLIMLYKGLWLIPFILTVFSVSLFFKRNINPIIPVLLGLAIIISSILLSFFILSGISAPLLDIIHKLGD